MTPFERRILTATYALESLKDSEDIELSVSPSAFWEFMFACMCKSGAAEGVLPPTQWETPMQTLSQFFDLGEVEALHYAIFEDDPDGVFRGVFLGNFPIVRESVIAYTLFTDSLRYSGIYPDARTRLRKVLARCIAGRSLHLSDPFPDIPMDRFTSARKALVRAHVLGRLAPGRYSTCALQAILAPTTLDFGWVTAYEAYVHGALVRDEVAPFSYYAALTGFSEEELVQIEAAFEHGHHRKDTRRLSSQYSVTPEGRLLAVFETLDKIEFAL